MAEKFIIACTFCQKQYPVDDRMVGRRVKCKNCGEVFMVPKPPAHPMTRSICRRSMIRRRPTRFPPPRRPRCPAQPAYTPPPAYTQSAPKQSWAGNWNTGGRRAWWSIPVVLIVIALRFAGVFHFNFGSKTGIWNTHSASSMTIEQKRDQTAANLRLLGPELRKWAPTATRTSSPEKLYFSDVPHSVFVSPFSPYSSGTDDYKFIHLSAMRDGRFGNVIVLYDNSELSANDGTTVYRVNGATDHLSKEDFHKQVDADELAMTPAPQFPFPPMNRTFFAPRQPMPIQPPTFRPPAIAPPNSPNPPPSQGYLSIQTPPPPPPRRMPTEQPDADPPIPAHAWTADPDPPVALPKIAPHFRKVFPGNAEFYFPPQPSEYFLLNRAPSMSYHGPLTAELWNLHTAMRADTMPAIHPMDDSILSPDGHYFVGRTMGGQGLATVFEVWSPRTGKLLQTLSGPPVTGGELPVPVGFLPGDRLLSVGDHFDVWDLKSGTHVRQFGDGLNFDSHQLAAISATGKLAALVTADHRTVALFDTEAGKLLGQSPIPDRQARRFEFDNALDTLIFSPDGQQLALLLGGDRIYDWKVADGSLAERFTINPRIDRNNFRKVDSKSDSLVWLPDSESWLAGGDRVIDRLTGTAIYQMPNFTEEGAREYGQRQVIDDTHVLLGFRTNSGDKSALETLAFDDAELKKTQSTLRAAATQPAAQPQ